MNFGSATTGQDFTVQQCFTCFRSWSCSLANRGSFAHAHRQRQAFGRPLKDDDYEERSSLHLPMHRVSEQNEPDIPCVFDRAVFEFPSAKTWVVSLKMT
jgi:hypothetical protein